MCSGHGKVCKACFAFVLNLYREWFLGRGDPVLVRTLSLVHVFIKCMQSMTEVTHTTLSNVSTFTVLT